MEVYIDSVDEDIVIPAGVYPFGYDSIAGTAQACVGVKNNRVEPTFIGYLASNGNLDSLWIPISGSITVNKLMVLGEPQIQLIMDAKNSFGKTAKVVVNVPPTYYFKHPWNGGEWTWKEAADTTYLGIDASYVVAQWGDNGFNFNIAAEDAGAEWYVKDIIGTASLDGNVGIGYPAVGTEVTFVCLHDNYEAVIGGGRAWIVYDPKTALENTAAGVKAAKIIENGQVIILREGKRYNVVGAEL